MDRAAIEENLLRRTALGEGGKRTATFELDAATNQFAHHLMDSGLNSGNHCALNL